MNVQMDDSTDCTGLDAVANTLHPQEGQLEEWTHVEGVIMPEVGYRSAQINLILVHGEAGSLQMAWFDNVFLQETDGACTPNDLFACLGNGRFSVRAYYIDNAGDPTTATPHALTADSLAYSFFEPSNLELNVKILNACALPAFRSYWVIASGSTNLGVGLFVHDEATGRERSYFNEPGATFETLFDLGSFPCAEP
jgi:hypothetical protein